MTKLCCTLNVASMRSLMSLFHTFLCQFIKCKIKTIKCRRGLNPRYITGRLYRFLLYHFSNQDLKFYGP